MSSQSVTVAGNSRQETPGSLPSLPNEVWLQTFQYMDYQTLKVCSMVNKSFKSIVNHSSLDEVLFRRVKPLAGDHKFKDADDIIVHPAFEWISCRCDEYDLKKIAFAPSAILTLSAAERTQARIENGGMTDDEIRDKFVAGELYQVLVSEMKWWLKQKDIPVTKLKKAELQEKVKEYFENEGATQKAYEVVETSAAKEYATMPPLQKLQVKVCDCKAVWVENAKGVTVMDVLTSLFYEVFQDSAWSYRGRLKRITGKRNGMTWLDFEDHEPDECPFAHAFLPGILWKGFDEKKINRQTKNLMLCWKEKEMKGGDWVKLEN